MTANRTSYQEQLAWLYGLQKFGIKLGLENIQRLIGELNLAPAADQRDTAETAAPQFPEVIHIAGTNGKGSVAAMIDAICRAAGLCSGLFTSPHLVTFRERIQVNGELIPEEDVARNLIEIRHLIRDWDPHPTFFEVVTALALKHFKEHSVQVIVLETGLGGRLDATNAVRSNVAVITPVGLDHQKWLGNSIREIASEKAGIIKPGTPVVSSSQSADAEKVIRARAAECEAPLHFVTDPYHHAPVALRGAHQQSNAAVAVAAIGAAQLDIGDAAIARGLMSVNWPARFQRWDDRIIIDGAHNPAAAAVLAQTWREVFGSERATIILAVLADKDASGICHALAPIADSFVLPPIQGERALAPAELAQALFPITPKLQYSIAASVSDALESARSRAGPILLTGSLHFAGEALAFLQNRPAAFEECSQ